MKRLSPVFMSLALALACTPDDGADADTAADETTGDGDTGDGDGDTTTGDGDGDTTTGDGDGDTGTEAVATITGTVVGMDGQPLPMPGIQWCGPIDAEGNVELCIPIDVEPSDGSFEIGSPFVGLWNFKAVHGSVEGRYFTGQAFQLTVEEGMDIAWTEPIVIPEIDTVTPLTDGSQDVAIDAALTITIDPANAQSPDFTAPTELGGLMVPAEYWQVTEVESAPVIAAWSFSPFGVKATSGSFGVTLDDALGLAADETVTLWYIEKDNAVIHEAGIGTVNADATGIDVVETGEGVHELTWLLVTQ